MVVLSVSSVRVPIKYYYWNITNGYLLAVISEFPDIEVIFQRGKCPHSFQHEYKYRYTGHVCYYVSQKAHIYAKHIWLIYPQCTFKWIGGEGYDMTWRIQYPVSPLDKRYYNV